MKKIKYAYAPGTIIQATDRQYKVDQNGSWRRIPTNLEVKGIVLKPDVPFHLDGRRTSDGAYCWCYECIEIYHPKVKKVDYSFLDEYVEKIKPAEEKT